MNSDLSPDYYRDASVSQSVADSKASIDYIRSIDPKGAIVRPIVTPRFAPSCTSECLSAIAALASSESTFIQTHISENKGEIALVQSLFPASKSYTDVYDTARARGASHRDAMARVKAEIADWPELAFDLLRAEYPLSAPVRRSR